MCVGGKPARPREASPPRAVNQLQVARQEKQATPLSQTRDSRGRETPQYPLKDSRAKEIRHYRLKDNRGKATQQYPRKENQDKPETQDN